MNGTLGLNILYDAFPNPEAAAASLFPYMDRTPIKSVMVSSGARAEQGHTFAGQLKARYPATDVVFRIIQQDGIHAHMSAQAWFDSMAPFSDGGKLWLDCNNEPGVNDLPAQDAWYATVIKLAGKTGITFLIGNWQTHNPVAPAQIDQTLRLCEQYKQKLAFHYYYDLENGFPIDPVHEIVNAYCAQHGIALPDTYITELGYAQRLASQAGHRGRIAGDVYGKQLAMTARRWPNVKFFVYDWGNQSPWGDFDLSGDKTVADELVAENQATAVPVPAPTPTPVTVNAPTDAGTKVKIAALPAGVDFRNIRAQPYATAQDVGDLKVNDVVIAHVDKPEAGWVYVARATDNVNGWTLWSGVAFTPTDAPVPDPDPTPAPAPEPMIEIPVSVYNKMYTAYLVFATAFKEMPVPSSGSGF